jgi:hypothetical protein
MWPFKSRDQAAVIEVCFVDVATGKEFARSKMPPERLPASFESQTTMHLKSGDWDVIEARPMLADEFRKSGKLVLLLRKVKIERVDLKDVLFSLPTISNELPPVIEGSSKLGKNILEIHEDDWRQVEWIAGTLRAQMEDELQQVRVIHEQHREEYGFKKIHVRETIPNPVGNMNLHLDQLRDSLGQGVTWLEAVSYLGVAGTIRDSFAARMLSSIELYGVAPNDLIQAIGFTRATMNNVPPVDLQRLVDFAADNDLILVDWCRLEVVAALLPDYSAYFKHGAG